MTRTLFFTGCCNRAVPYFATANGEGLAGFFLDEATGACTPAGVTVGIDNPTYAAVSHDGRQLFASSEMFEWNEGTVSVYDIDAENGALTYVNKVVTRGGVAAQVTVDRSDGFVTCVNYAFKPPSERPNRAAVVFRRQPDGELSRAVAEVGLSGTGPDVDRQDRSHAHCLRFSRDNTLALVADLGTDRVEIYRFDAGSGGMEHASAVDLPPGSGPRHIEMHPERDIAYVVNELSATLATIALDVAAATGQCVHVDRTVPEAARGHTHCSGVKISADGTNLYVGNRGHESVGILSIDPDGLAHFADTVPSGGATPRDLAFSPSGRVLAVANQDSDLVSFFSRDAGGGLVPLGPGVATGTPTCIAFVPPAAR